MAAPHVTGIAALIKAANPGFTPAQLRTRLEQGAVDLGPPGRDDRYGFGVANAYNSVTGTGGPPGTITVRAIDAATGQVTRSTTLAGDGRFTFANLPAANYFLVAGQDEAGDGLAGVPGRRFNWLGTAGMAPVTMTGSAIKTVAFTLATPSEAEPNDDNQHATPLVVNSWVAGNVGTPDARDVYTLMIPVAGTYTFETSGAVGSCGYAGEVDTVLRLFDATGAQLAANDDTPFPTPANPAGTATYPGTRCSLITQQLTAGRYYVEVSPFVNSSGMYRLHIRAGS
jgi:hypothetical protein